MWLNKLITIGLQAVKALQMIASEMHQLNAIAPQLQKISGELYQLNANISQLQKVSSEVHKLNMDLVSEFNSIESRILDLHLKIQKSAEPLSELKKISSELQVTSSRIRQTNEGLANITRALIVGNTTHDESRTDELHGPPADRIPIEELGFSTRTYNALHRDHENRFITAWNILSTSKMSLMKVRNLGVSSYEEIRQKMLERFNVDIADNDEDN